MWFSSWLHKKQRSPAPHRRSTFRPTLEALERRWLPSHSTVSTVLTVTNILDSGTGSLRYEIAQAEQSKATDTIVFNLAKSDQDYTGHWTITLTPSEGQLTIGRSLNIQGPGAGQLTILGLSGVQVFQVLGGQVSLSGLCIENGGNTPYPHPYGGGIYNDGTLTVSGCRLTGNVAGLQGGGIYNVSTLTVSGCELDNNSAVDGEGGGIFNSGTLTVSDSQFSFNSDASNFEISSAIFNNGSLTVSGSTFIHNYFVGPYTDGGGNTFITGAPQVGSLTASASSVTAGSPLTLTAANITDPNPNSSITEVAFYDGNGFVGYGAQTSPGVWTLTFSTTGWAVGTYTFTVWAMDNYGVWSEASPTVTVQVT
jgi:hypothetical protein